MIMRIDTAAIRRDLDAIAWADVSGAVDAATMRALLDEVDKLRADSLALWSSVANIMRPFEDEIPIAATDAQTAEGTRASMAELRRLRADVSAMLPIVEAVAAISADRCCGLDCLHDDARRFLDARRK